VKIAKSLVFILLALSAAAARPRQDDKGVRRLSIPGRSWALEISLPGFVVEPYRKALELEKQSPRLPRDLWRVLVTRSSAS
jgi:hypothetical protein